MKIFLKFYVISIILCSCAALGTDTLYKANHELKISKIGFLDLDNDTLVSKIFVKTNEVYCNTVKETFSKFELYDVQKINEEIPYENPDSIRIIEICKKHNLEGILLAKLKFIHVSYSVNFIPLGKNYDTQVDTKLFDSRGKLVLSTRHNTYKGNSYMMLPSSLTTVHDGAEGAIKRIMKEMENN